MDSGSKIVPREPMRTTTVLRRIDDRRRKISAVRSGLRTSLAESTFANIFTVLVGGAYLTGYALLLGASDIHLGILGALPMFAAVPGLAGAWLADRLRSRKKVVIALCGVGRLMWIPIILLPYLPAPGLVVMTLFIALFAVSSLSQGIGVIVWQGWMSDLVPEKLRGRFWGARNQYVNAGAICGMLFAGALLDWFLRHNREMLGYQFLFLCAMFFGIASLRKLRRQYEPPLQEAKLRGFWANVAVPLRDRAFAPALWGLALFQFSVGLVGVFVSAYMLKHLQMTFTQISVLNIFHLIIGIIVSPIWGYAMDHSGMKSVAIVNGILVSMVPLMWVMSLSAGLWMVWALWALSGIGWVGFSLVVLNLPFALSPRAGRSYYLAVNGIVMGIAYFVGSLVGGLVAEWLGDWQGRIGPFRLVNYSVLFFISALGRLASLLFFVRIREVRRKPLLESINFAGSLAWTRLLDWGGQGMRIVSSGWKPKS